MAGIHLTDIPSLHYEPELFQERALVSVTANTRADGQELLGIAAQIPIQPTTTAYPFSAADQALADLAADRVTGAAFSSWTRPPPVRESRGSGRRRTWYWTAAHPPSQASIAPEPFAASSLRSQVTAAASWSEWPRAGH